MIWLLNGVLLVALIILAIWALKTRDLLVSAMILSVYSFLMAIIYAQLNSPDVALTEAAVGAGITTVLFILAIQKTSRMEEDSDDEGIQKGPLAIVLVIGLILALAAGGMPSFGSPDAPAAVVSGNLYLEEAKDVTGVVNIVTAIIAYYRSFDTLGEVTVVFAVGIGIIALFLKRREEEGDDGR
ncbi:multicomponent Na+:H+ antiporter subunit B [Methanocalculus alkaliphilus]|uniref:DUF4040 domain-containing protein n=1 Tax=Methanocalculus alkaliphilus TaxID=768730 RepID=UPI00209E10A1|nr:DUF4040 domain-containing protein [Methanocalculus alkaliphilus]MCP1714666.1 multicomponent Na+:H+ antiporter subunit B [Methanocalculus alkaliphilus]